jgi:hypothetical protein
MAEERRRRLTIGAIVAGAVVLGVLIAYVVMLSR